MAKKLICSGNCYKTSYFAATGVAEYIVGVKDAAEDEINVYYEDGLYKLFVNGELKMAATGVLIKTVDYTGLRNH